MSIKLTEEINSVSLRFVEGLKTILKLQDLRMSYDGYGTRLPNKIAVYLVAKDLLALEDLGSPRA